MSFLPTGKSVGVLLGFDIYNGAEPFCAHQFSSDTVGRGGGGGTGTPAIKCSIAMTMRLTGIALAQMCAFIISKFILPPGGGKNQICS